MLADSLAISMVKLQLTVARQSPEGHTDAMALCRVVT
jgi:hypothetical protein